MGIVENLAKHNYIIIPNDKGEMCIKKINGKTCRFKGQIWFDSKTCLKYAEKLLKKLNKKLIKWDVVVRFNRGLGAEFKTLLPIDAYNIAEAQQLAEQQANAIIGTTGYEKMVINQVKVRVLTI